MSAGKQLKTAILARRAAKGPRKKRVRPQPRQYTIADWQRARDRVAAAERRIDNDCTSNPNWGRAGLSERSSNCPSSSHRVATTLARPPCATSLSNGWKLSDILRHAFIQCRRPWCREMKEGPFRRRFNSAIIAL